jgi:hypothetical protein
MDIILLDYVKNILGFIFGFFIVIGSSVEPSLNIWIVSIFGALITAIYGFDKNVSMFLSHIFLGLGCGIFGSQLAHFWFNISQVPVSFFFSVLGVEFIWFMKRNFKETKFIDLLSTFAFFNKSNNKDREEKK